MSRAFQEVLLFIPKLPLHLCVNESHDSFSINRVGEQKGKKYLKAKDWHFTLWKLARKSYFLHFGSLLRRGQVSETRGCPQLGHIPPSLGLHTNPLRLSRHTDVHAQEKTGNSRGECDWNADSTQSNTEVSRRKHGGGWASRGTKEEGLCPKIVFYHPQIESPWSRPSRIWPPASFCTC